MILESITFEKKINVGLSISGNLKIKALTQAKKGLHVLEFDSVHVMVI